MNKEDAHVHSGILLSHKKSDIMPFAAIWMDLEIIMVQLSHLYMSNGKTIALTNGKIIALTIWTFVGKVMSLLFNMLSRFVIAFLPMGQVSLNFMVVSPSTVIWEPKKIKSITASTFSPFICHEAYSMKRLKQRVYRAEVIVQTESWKLNQS